MLRTENISSQFSEQIFASIYKNYFLTMLKKIANRRVTNTPDEEKIVVVPGIVNELTEMSAYSSESFLTSSNEQKTNRSFEK